MRDEIPEQVYTDAAHHLMAVLHSPQSYDDFALAITANDSWLRAIADSAYAAGMAAATGGEWEYGRRVTDDEDSWDEWPMIGEWTREYAPIAGPTPEGATVNVLRRWRIRGPVEVVPAHEEKTDA